MTRAKKNDPEKNTPEHVLFQTLPISIELFPFSCLPKLSIRVRCRGRTEGKDITELVGTKKITELSFFDISRVLLFLLLFFLSPGVSIDSSWELKTRGNERYHWRGAPGWPSQLSV